MPGDAVGIVAPARKVQPSEVEPAIRMLEDWGLQVVLGKNIFGENNQFSGTDQERASDFQSMIDDSNIKAILCARGGYGTIRIFEHINLRALQREPKWIVGFSDITALHGVLNSWYMMETIHGVMPFNFPKDGVGNTTTNSLKNILFGLSPDYVFPPSALNRYGEGQGLLVGGNLSIIYSSTGTDADINTSGKILFIEDIDEYLYHIDRMMMNLKRSGKLKNLAGLIVGGMTDMHDNTIPFGSSASEIIHNTVANYSYPVCFGFPAGHQDENLALIMGRRVSLKVSMNGCQLTFNPASCAL
jgi:muramoyltetrapeptide carboxypeptidase